MSYAEHVTLEERRQLVAMMRDEGVREFSVEGMHVRFGLEASAEDQHEHPVTTMAQPRPRGGLVPREPNSST